MTIQRLTTDHLRIPLPRTSRIALTAPRPRPFDHVELILVHLETANGVSGLGLTYTLGPGAAAIRSLIDTELAPLIRGEDPHATDRLFRCVESRFAATTGFRGLVARAYCAIDIALWDLRAKAADVPLAQLLGHAKSAAGFVVSPVAVGNNDPQEVLQAAKTLLQQGATGLRVEMTNTEDLQSQADQLREIQDQLGADIWLGVAAAGRFDLATALALSHFFDDIGVDLFEDPLPDHDHTGYQRLCHKAEIPIAVGSHFDAPEQFWAVIRAGDIRVIRPDVCRLGGITPLVSIARVAEAFDVAVMPVRLPEVGVHLACGLPVVPHVDYVPWFQELFPAALRIERGKIVPAPEPGLGLQLHEPTAALFRVNGAQRSE
ncbi:MAG: mandelate racemase/muconate lactonizing enzyme family protein [Gemmataceae bacterium]|nr:mandelate racemase/muconate lactonizing enzyme family protein [Gemmata sp.]MDW8196456.1 mandelate racemase/muconate lactonizing enzyme family protein [Gemmataceae bacterium]